MSPSWLLFKNVSRLATLSTLLLLAPNVHSQAPGSPAPGESDAMESAVRMTLGASTRTAQYDYVMRARIRLLVFWKGADDVGGGYIRRSINVSDPNVRLISVLFGSDPAKAPRAINNWGTATEAIGEESGAIWGFMKSANPESADAAQADIQKQKSQGKHSFSAILAFVDKNRALSRSVPLFSDVDFNLHQVDQAQQVIAGRLSEDRAVRRMDPTERRCANPRGFLKAVEELIDHALTSIPKPASRCYVHNARNYTVTLTEATPVSRGEIKVNRKNGTALKSVYRNLVKAKFAVVNYKSERSTFELLLGTEGDLKGVPVQIVHRPNFWFEVELNLDNSAGNLNTP